MPNSARIIEHDATEPSSEQQHPRTGPTHVVDRAQQQEPKRPRASNAALAWLATADVPPSARRLGVFLAKHARPATAGDLGRKVGVGEIFCYWTQAKIAEALGCGVRHVKTALRSLRDAGGWETRRRVRPYGASYVFVAQVIPSEIPSVIPSEIPSQREPRTEPCKENHVRRSGATMRAARPPRGGGDHQGGAPAPTTTPRPTDTPAPTPEEPTAEEPKPDIDRHIRFWTEARAKYGGRP